MPQMAGAQRPTVSQDFVGEAADIVFVIEDTSNIDAYFNFFKTNYIEKMLKWVYWGTGI